MLITIQTPDASSLEKEIFLTAEKGYISGWKLVEKNKKKYLTQSHHFDSHEGLLSFSSDKQELNITIQPYKRQHLSDKTKANYISKFMEILLVHFNEHYSIAQIQYLDKSISEDPLDA